MQFIEDSVVPTERFIDYLRSLEDILTEERTKAVIFGHAGDASAHVNPLVDVRAPEWRGRVRRILEATTTLVAGLGGTLSGEHGDGRIRAPFLDRVWGPALAGAFREVKRTLDPQGVFNPGVIVPLRGQDTLEGLGPWRREVP
jgi:FAD/FMN-containing dehydrogenase